MYFVHWSATRSGVPSGNVTEAAIVLPSSLGKKTNGVMPERTSPAVAISLIALYRAPGGGWELPHENGEIVMVERDSDVGAALGTVGTGAEQVAAPHDRSELTLRR
jgi:hypothetical protein